LVVAFLAAGKDKAFQFDSHLLRQRHAFGDLGFGYLCRTPLISKDGVRERMATDVLPGLSRHDLLHDVPSIPNWVPFDVGNWITGIPIILEPAMDWPWHIGMFDTVYCLTMV
jgi:hypothetical protein